MKDHQKSEDFSLLVTFLLAFSWPSSACTSSVWAFFVADSEGGKSPHCYSPRDRDSKAKNSEVRDCAAKRSTSGRAKPGRFGSLAFVMKNTLQPEIIAKLVPNTLFHVTEMRFSKKIIPK